MKHLMVRLGAGMVASFLALMHPATAAEPVIEPDTDIWHHNLQDAATPVMERITEFHTLLLWMITGICIFVFALTFYICLRFRAKANPEPSKTTHNTLLEVAWTVVPVLMLAMIVLPSFRLLYYADRTAEPDMTIKATGYQWYWNYTYTGEEEFAYDSRIIDEKEIDPSKGQRRLLSVDNPLVIPVDTNIQILVTAGPDDVLHSFAVPSFGVKLDAVPGRINETWTRVTRPGVYYGQCSELCGKGHAFMPIEVHAVSKEEYKKWRESAFREYADSSDVKAGPLTIRLAQTKGN